MNIGTNERQIIIEPIEEPRWLEEPVPTLQPIPESEELTSV